MHSLLSMVRVALSDFSNKKYIFLSLISLCKWPASLGKDGCRRIFHDVPHSYQACHPAVIQTT